MSSANDDVRAAAAIVRLGKHNYARWLKLLRLALRGRDLLDTIDPALAPVDGAPGVTPEKLLEWKKKCDRSAYIIGSSCEAWIQNKILKYDSPVEMMDVARKECQSTSYANTARYLRALFDLAAGSKGDMRTLMDEIDSAYENLEGVGYELTEKAKIVHLLAALPQSYASLSMAMDVLGEAATYDRLQLHIIEEEHRQTEHSNRAQREIAMVAHQGPQSGAGGKGPSKFSGKCHYCGKKGHMKKDCRKKKSDEGGSEQAALAIEEPSLYMGQVMVCDDTPGKTRPLTFIVDSGATKHIACERRWFESYEPAEPGRYILAANGSKLVVKGIGTIKFRLRKQWISIPGTLHVPQAKYNLLSVDSMCQVGLSVTFANNFCSIYQPDGGLLARVERDQGQYLFTSGADRSYGTALTSTEDVAAEALLEHERRAHLHAAGMLAAQQQGKIALKLNLQGWTELLKRCKGCQQGKQVMKSHDKKATHSHADGPGRRIHADVIGPITPVAFPALGSARFALMIVDDWSRYLWAFPIQFKAQATSVLKRFLLTMERKYPARVLAYLRTDNGTEFVNMELGEFMKEKGITHERTAPYTPQSNGVVERANRTVVEAARSLLQGRGLDLRLWPAALVTAVFVLNRTWRKTPADQTPVEAYLGAGTPSPPLRAFGAPCWVLRNEKEGKFGSKSVKMMFIGYEHSDTYRLWDTRTERVMLSRHVVFNEREQETSSPPVPPADAAQEAAILDVGEADASRSAAVRSEQSNADPRFVARVAAAQKAVQQQIAAAQAKAREMMDLREKEAREERERQRTETQTPQQNEDTQQQQPVAIEATPLRSSRRLAGADPELDHALLAAAVGVTERQENPRTLKEAMQRADRQKWEAAVRSELAALKETGTYEVVDTPPGANVLTGKWVLAIKYNADGTINKHKARWVARGYSQIEGIDFDETHAPTARMTSVRMVGALSAAEDLELHQWDYTTAYLNGLLHNEVYIRPPEGVELPAGKCWKLVKALYGLKQAGREWNTALVDLLKSMDFEQSRTDASVFVRRSPKLVIIVVYVDDILIAAEKGEDLKKLKSELAARFKGKDLGEAHHMLGIEIHRNRAKRTLTMTQRQYAKDVLERFGMSNCKPARTPMESKVSLTPRAEGEPEGDQTTYRGIVGSLMYLAQGTRPDLAFPVSVLGRHAANPSAEHLIAAKRVLRYLKGTVDATLTFQGKDGLRIQAYVDADWAGDRTDRKSTSGFAILMAGGAVTWGSKKQTAVALSTTEAEYVAAGLAAREAIALTYLLQDVGKNVSGIEIFCDNQAAISVTKNPVLYGRTKHIDIAHHWLKDAVANKQVGFTYIPTDQNPADALTKGLPIAKLSDHRMAMGVVAGKDSDDSRHLDDDGEQEQG